ncbi:MAG: hypothetical protein DRI65_06075, partial [Chloroflexota bacterium]
KLYDARIEKRSHELQEFASVIGLPAQFKNQEEYLQWVNSRTDALFDLMTLRDRVRAAITTSNSTTEIVISGKTLTIAVALNLKLGIELGQNVVTRLANSMNAVQNRHTKHELIVEDNADKQIKAMFGDNKPTADEYKNMRDAYMKANLKPLLFSEKLRNKLIVHADSIEDFQNTIDYALTTSNVNTTITVPE